MVFLFHVPVPMIIEGQIVPGMRVASRNLPRQLSLIQPVFPAIAGAHPASINVLLPGPVRIVDPDFVTPPLAVTPSRTEIFSLTEILFACPVEAEACRAWIVEPHGSPHKLNDYLVEVVTRRLDTIAYGAACRIHLTRVKGAYGTVVV
ncbi:MAG: hypothetical protein U1E70_15680 [Acetobacteraceae bacterium]|nr:hypothetical protein [Pseudomonadota bacterium]